VSNKPKPRAASSLPPPKPAPTVTVGGRRRAPTAWIVGGVIAAVVLVAVIVVVVVGGGDKDHPPSYYARPVEVVGDPLPDFTEEMAGGAPDTAVGEQAPVVKGQDYTDAAVTIDAQTDGPTLVVVLAHWCPHCNNEIPRLNQWRESGRIPAALNIVGVSTAVQADAANYPPDSWLKAKDWQWPVISDTVDATAMAAFGATGFPTLIFIGSDGEVRWRMSGEIPLDQIEHQVATAMAAEA